ncbi:MAG: serine/threonine protein kinase [Myxococcaceae bacterium]|nr:serine/threonine protein kinase [Myxococcaceae bacterium]
MTDALRYRAIRKIADGGSAEVFLGEQVGAAGFRRDVVLKRIHPRLLVNEQFRQMLIDEAHLAMSLTHPNLVQVLDVGESAGASFLVLELVDGWTLGQVARRGYEAGLPIPPELACFIAAEICRGLEYAHARKRDGQPLHIVHRDICPNNVLVSMHAEVKVADFGIARASSRADTTRSGMIRGKPMYMSPEQALGRELDARSDLFSVGTVLFWLLTGELPFKGPADQEFLTQIITTDAPSPATIRPELPDEVCRVVQKAMARDRDQRFSSARELLTALEQAQRTALKPAGRSELETWLRQLSAKDGETPISRQTMPPAPSTSQPEWISLSAQNSVVDDQTATQRGLPTFSPEVEPPRRWPVVAVGFVIGVLAVAAFGVFSDPAPPPPAPRAETQPVVLSDDVLPQAQGALNEVDSGAAGPSELDSANTDVGAVDAGALALAVPPEDDAEEPSVDASVPSFREGRASKSREGAWTMSARLAPKQPPAPMIAILLESVPAGLAVRVDKHVLGHTPVTLRFRKSTTYDVWFEGAGRAPLRRWLMLTERSDGAPRVTLRAPVEPP